MKWVFGLIYGIALVAVVVTYRGWGISWDEEFYKESGKFYLANFGADWETVAEKIPEYHALTHGAVVDAVYYVPFWLGLPESFENLHLVKGLIGSLALVGVFLGLRELMGKKSWGPMVGMVLLMTYPRWVGDVFDNFMDGSATLLYALEIWLALKGKWVALSGVGAVAFSHRPALVIVPVLAAIRYGWRRWLVMAVVFYGVLWLVDPYIRTHGIVGIDRKVSMTADYFVYRGEQLFEGKYIFAKDLPGYYLPKWVGITTPLGTLVLGAIGMMVMKKGWRKLVVGGALVVPVAAAMVLRPTLYDGWRVFLFLSGPLVVLAAIGWDWLFNRKQIMYKYTALALLIITVGLSVRAMIQLHPYEYVYFNELVGGLKGVDGQYETDYWGKTNREAVEWFKNNVAIDSTQIYLVKTCATKLSSTYFFATNMIWVPTLTQADYFICFTRHDEHKAVTDANTLYIVERQGVPLNYIKRVR
ncbi:MAG: hypothetical protein HY381_02220 [Candidatus Chisholmbacteria bacterium]|nr:hypothetical protein [Candidatus Chisholmbacteria bacterium]